MTATETLWTDADIISTYTRQQAIADGVLIDCCQGDWHDVCRQHYRWPIAMTAAVFDIMRQAVENKRACNDYCGVLHDILWMSRVFKRQVDDQTALFQVKIVGAGRQSIYEFKIVCGPDDNGEPCLTIMLPDED